jgi:hypothetical protein
MNFKKFAGISFLGLAVAACGEGLADRIRLGDAMVASQWLHVVVAGLCLAIGAAFLSPKS